MSEDNVHHLPPPAPKLVFDRQPGQDSIVAFLTYYLRQAQEGKLKAAAIVFAKAADGGVSSTWHVGDKTGADLHAKLLGGVTALQHRMAQMGCYGREPEEWLDDAPDVTPPDDAA